MDNVYIKQETNIAYGRGQFYIVLPGVRATLIDREDGVFVLEVLQADLSYMQGQNDALRPGLWRVNDMNFVSDPELSTDGTIQHKEYRTVVVSDRSADDPRRVAQGAHNDLLQTNRTIKQMVLDSGFDLHFTPGKRIIGLKSAKRALSKESDSAIVESAMLLANTMFKARNIKGVQWYADWGGSVILTRALQILAQEKLAKFEQHRIILHRPTSNSSQAEKLAQSLKMGIIKKNTGLTPREILGNHLQADLRWGGVAKAGALGLSGAGAAFSIAGVTPTIAGAVGFAGALYFIGETVIKAAKQFSGKKYPK